MVTYFIPSHEICPYSFDTMIIAITWSVFLLTLKDTMVTYFIPIHKLCIIQYKGYHGLTYFMISLTWKLMS